MWPARPPGVGLVHELRQLRGAVELLDGGHDRADVDEALRGDVICILAGHALADNTLHAAHADAELVLHELAHGADAAVAKVVDVVELLVGIALVKREQVAQGADDVLGGEDLLVCRDVQAELLVDLVATNAGQVIALVVEVEALDEGASGVHGGRLAGALATVDLDEGVFARGGDVALDGGADDVGVSEEVHDLIVGLRNAEGAQQDRRALATLAVDGDDQVAVLVDLKLEPGAARGNELHMVHLHAVVDLRGEVHARRADELRHDDALGAIDDEGASVGHEREVAHEDELFLDFAGLLVDEAHLDEEGCLIGDVLGAAFGDGAWRVAKLVLAKRHLHRSRGVLDGRELSEGLGKPIGHEVLERLLLDRDKVGQRHGLRDLAEADPLTLFRLRGNGFVMCSHQANPPQIGKKAAVAQRNNVSDSGIWVNEKFLTSRGF